MCHIAQLVFGLIVLAVIAQAQDADPQMGVERWQPQPEPRNKVDDLLKKLRKVVDKALDDAQKALDRATNKVNEVADKIQGAAKTQMQGIVNGFKAEVNKLKEKAKNAGVNIDDCLNGNEDKLANLPNQLSNDMIHCVSDKVNQGISYAQDALKQARKIVDLIENIKSEIKECGHGFSAVKCIAKLAVKIEQAITTFPAKIQKDVAATVLLITKLQEEVKKCASTKVDQCENDGKKILETISVCVAKKLIP